MEAETPAEFPKPKPEHSTELRDSKSETSAELPKVRSSSGLPPDFFDKNETKRQKTGKNLSWPS